MSYSAPLSWVGSIAVCIGLKISLAKILWPGP